jgi:hypothetical protein
MLRLRERRMLAEELANCPAKLPRIIISLRAKMRIAK